MMSFIGNRKQTSKAKRLWRFTCSHIGLLSGIYFFNQTFGDKVIGNDSKIGTIKIYDTVFGNVKW